MMYRFFEVMMASCNVITLGWCKRLSICISRAIVVKLSLNIYYHQIISVLAPHLTSPQDEHWILFLMGLS